MCFNYGVYDRGQLIDVCKTNHSVSFEQALELLGFQENPEKINHDEPDYYYKGKYYYFDDITVALIE